MRLVLVEWVDSYGGTTGWKPLEDCSPDVLICRSVGWLLHDTDTCKVLVPHLVQPDPASRIAEQGRGDMTIPTAAVLRIVDLTPTAL
jgi:hypothetical protein